MQKLRFSFALASGLPGDALQETPIQSFKEWRKLKMRRQTGTLTSIVALLVLFAGISVAQQRAKEKPQPKFEPAQVLSTTDVVYPIASIAFGPVALEVTVGENGEIEDIKVTRDIPSLTREAKRSVERWTFAPAKLDGKPIRSSITVVVVFNKPCVAP